MTSTSRSAMDWTSYGGTGPALYQSFLAPAMFAPFGELLAESAGVAAGERVLDVACGTGVVSRIAARRAGTGGAVTGVDLAGPMLAFAGAQPAADGAAAITYVEGSAEALPVPDAAFDVVTCQQGLQFFGDRAAALREMRRALVPGGRVAIATWAAIERQPHYVALQEAVARHLGDGPAAGIAAPHVLGDAAELRGLLEDAGLAEVRVDVETRPTTYASLTDFAPLAIGAGPIGPAFAAAPAAQQEAVAADVREALRDRGTADGRLRSEMTTLLAVARRAR